MAVWKDTFEECRGFVPLGAKPKGFVKKHEESGRGADLEMAAPVIDSLLPTHRTPSRVPSPHQNPISLPSRIEACVQMRKGELGELR